MARKRPPATPVQSGLLAAFIAFVGPVLMGLVSGDMTGRGFGAVVLLTAGVFLLVYGLETWRHHHRAA